MENFKLVIEHSETNRFWLCFLHYGIYFFVIFRDSRQPCKFFEQTSRVSLYLENSVFDVKSENTLVTSKLISPIVLKLREPDIFGMDCMSVARRKSRITSSSSCVLSTKRKFVLILNLISTHGNPFQGRKLTQNL